MSSDSFDDRAKDIFNGLGDPAPGSLGDVAGAADITLPAGGARGPAPHSGAIEGYEILREIHRGGQGVVYQAMQQITRRKVAIKVLLDGPYASSAARKRFEREIELAAKLKHPNIVSILHAGQTSDGRQFCVMDYVRGEPLDVYAQKLSFEDTLVLFAKVCDAVNHAHWKGVIHRDLKPSNVLVDSDGEPRVLDFGLAKQMIDRQETMLTLTGQVVGTLPYMSPEQAEGSIDKVDFRTDVYALGVVFYQVLTGQFPYPIAGKLADVLRHIAETPPTPPSRSWTHELGVTSQASKKLRAGACPIDNRMQAIVMRSLQKERDLRYQSAGELARDIGRYLNDEPIEATKHDRWYVPVISVSRDLVYKYQQIPNELRIVLLVILIGAPSTIVYLLSDLIGGLFDTEPRNRRTVGALVMLGAIVGIMILGFLAASAFRYLRTRIARRQ